MKYLSSLISILWARTWPYLAMISGFAAILWVLGAISLLCGMPPMGSEGMGNAITKIPEIDNGLAVIMIIVVPIILVVGVIAACRHIWSETALFFQEVKRETNRESECRGKFKAEWPNPPNDKSAEKRMIDSDVSSFDGNPN